MEAVVEVAGGTLLVLAVFGAVYGLSWLMGRLVNPPAPRARPVDHPVFHRGPPCVTPHPRHRVRLVHGPYDWQHEKVDQ